jgi:hypothetical protein
MLLNFITIPRNFLQKVGKKLSTFIDISSTTILKSTYIYVHLAWQDCNLRFNGLALSLFFLSIQGIIVVIPLYMCLTAFVV